MSHVSLCSQAVDDRKGHPLPELFQCHGSSDELVLHEWGEQTGALLRKAGMSVSFHTLPGLHHQLCAPELELLRAWLLRKLPPEEHSETRA